MAVNKTINRESLKKIPRFARAVQVFQDDSLPDPADYTKKLLHNSPPATRIAPGGRIAICVGSRGIAGIDKLAKTVVEEVKARGAKPVIVPAMGSHGGATPEGQAQVLQGYGITQETMGCPILSSMEVVDLGTTDSGCPIYMDKTAYKSQGIVLMNRVKPHSILTGEVGSGLTKMLSLGLGKAKGAEVIHRRGLEENMVGAARVLEAKAPVLFGIAIVENSYDRSAHIEIVAPEEFEEADRRLLRLARSYLPGIPFDPLDVLVVRWIGKDISGAGMDPNVIGMHRRIGGAPRREIKHIIALDLTHESHGNAIGVGMADIITQRLKDKIDYAATYTNAINSDFLWGIKVPIALASDAEALELGCRLFDPLKARAILIRDTAHLEVLYLSEGLLEEARRNPRIRVAAEPRTLPFDALGNLGLG